MLMLLETIRVIFCLAVLFAAYKVSVTVQPFPDYVKYIALVCIVFIVGGELIDHFIDHLKQ